MTPTTSALRWRTLILLLLLGTAVGLTVQWGYATREGGWSSLLHVGESSEVRPIIESELGDIPLTPHLGHDGKYFYLQARAPFDTELLRAGTDHPAYRHRRVLYPLLAGGFGNLPPHLTLAGLVLVAALGFGLLTAASAVVGQRLGAGPWGVVAAVANVGVLESLDLLTSDALAFGLAMTGVACWMHRRTGWAVASLVAATLAKETFLLVALGLALAGVAQGRRRDAALVGAVPVVTLLSWAAFLAVWFPDSSASNDGITLPFLGILGALPVWFRHTAEALDAPRLPQVLSAATVLVALVAPIVAHLSRQRILTWLTVPWLAMAILSSHLVWAENAYRAFAPVLTFTLLGLSVYIRGRFLAGPYAVHEPVAREVAYSGR